MDIIIRLDKNSARPVYGQIIDGLVNLIRGGDLAPGQRLPSSRSLADRLGVNRSTVYRAYQELWALGYLDSRPGAYSTVRRRPEPARPRDRNRFGAIDWAARSGPVCRELARKITDVDDLTAKANRPGVVNFIALAPDSAFLPVDPFRKCMNEILTERGRSVLGYGDPWGYRPLREFIAQRMRFHGATVEAEEIILTSGAQNAVDLVLKLLGPGLRAAVESPTYSSALDLMRLNGVDMIGLPMTATGLDLAALGRVMTDRPPGLVYTIPNFHNPTGLTTDQAHREELLALCRTHRVPLLEDGFEEEMKYFGRAVLPIKSMDRDGVVIYVGTFSKVLFPGLRIGWIAADRDCVRRLVPLRRASALSGNHLDQAALDLFCRRGFYELHIKRMHRVYRRRMTAALAALDRFLDPEAVEWSKPNGGFTIWLTVTNPAASEAELTERLIEAGVALLPGMSHYPAPIGAGQGPRRACFRLSIARTDRATIDRGVRRLGRVFNQSGR